jgi:hypothetical protein
MTVDIWRMFNPSEKRYSWRQKSSAIHCKLFIISVGLSNITRKTYISYGFKSDQSFLTLEIDKQQLKKGKVFFFINLTHLFCLKYQLTNFYSMIQQQNKLTRRTFND